MPFWPSLKLCLTSHSYLMRRNFCVGYLVSKGVWALPAAEGDGRGNCLNRATKAILVILETRIFAMTPGGTLQPSALAGTLTPEALFLSEFDPETVYLKNVRTAGVCGFFGVVGDAACLSCFFFRPSHSLRTRNQLLLRRQAFRQLRPQRPHVAFQVLDGKDATPFGKIAHSGSLDEPGGGSVASPTLL